MFLDRHVLTFAFFSPFPPICVTIFLIGFCNHSSFLSGTGNDEYEDATRLEGVDGPSTYVPNGNGVIRKV